MSDESKTDPLINEHIPGWLCTCGHWQNDDFHCDCCGREPAWGCDCDICNGFDDEDDLFPEEDDEFWEDA